MFLEQALTGSYTSGTWLDLLWLVAWALMAFAAGRPGPAEPLRRGAGRPAVAVPVAAALLAELLLAFDHHLGLHPVARVLALVTLALAVGRLALTFREVRALGDSRRQARTDDLTGLANRRAFYERAAELAAVGAAERRALLLLDLDRFKEVNDSLGHQVGDQLLALVGPRLTGCRREGDLLARIGGDEFALLLADADEPEARRVAERIRVTLTGPSPSPSTASGSTSRRASGSRSCRGTAPRSTRCCAAPTWRCTRRRRPGKVSPCTRPTVTRTAGNGCGWRASCARRSPPAG
ncbi:MAG TPA: GGDEF domain-containing protein [Frankiaceae bacterium]|nr:GGDEF domain-containing protein [Frankiaceae bacterium]